MKRLNGILLLLAALLLSACGASKKIVAQPEPVKPAWHTLHAPSSMAEVRLDDQTLWIECSIQAVYDSLIVVSLKPLLGIEAYRIEATPTTLTIIDRLQLQYATTTYQHVNTLLQPNMSYAQLQAFADQEPGEEKIELDYRALGHSLHVKIQHTAIEKDGIFRLSTIQKSRYTQVSLKQMIMQ